MKLLFESIKQAIEVEGNTLLTTEYLCQNQRLEYICGNCKQHKITTWSKWRQGQRCSCLSKHKKITNEFAHQSFAAEGNMLLSKFINNSVLMKYKCGYCKQHKKISWGNWQQGHRCTCMENNKRITNMYERFKQEMGIEKYILLSPISNYKNNRSLMKYKCNKNHHNKMHMHNWTIGNRCPDCTKTKGSRGEREVAAFIYYYTQEIRQGMEILFNNRKLIKNPKSKRFLEIDILIPELKIAIEYGASWWHGDKRNNIIDSTNRMMKDNYKKKWLKDNGWKYLVIVEDKWKKNKDWDMVENFINN